MPRIDPIQLLKCLSVLLSPSGGIKSNDEVERLASLMTKFSKKLVSKCIYIQILKCTETDLLGLFMGSGGWRLVHMWLTESIVAKNWPLVRELLELLLLCPVDVERLKTNNCPKLVKELSKDGNHYAIRALASKLVEQWLKAVKGEQVTPISVADIPEVILDFQSDIKCEISKNDVTDIEAEKLSNDLEKSSIIENDKEVKSENDVSSSENVNNNDENDAPSNENESLPVLKITLKNGKQILSQVEDDRKASEDDSEKEKNREKHKSKNRDKSQDKSSSNKESSNSSRSSSSRRSSSSSKSSDKGKSSSHKDSSSKHSSKDKYKDKDRHSSHSSKSKSSSSSSSKKSSSSSNSSSSSKVKDEKSSQKHSSDKDKSREKDKDSKSSSEKSDSKTQTPSIQKLGKIPKLSDVKKEKPSISIEIRKPDEPKPKTVKTFHSKFRNHGLAEEIKPPPSRATLLNKKPPPAIPPTVSIPKRPSPVHNETPPEKKPKTLLEIDKPGAIKLIPPKHKPMVLQESDMFMDALNASATNKKEPKKRKRRTSGSKDAQSDGSPPQTPTSASSPNSESKSVPPRFYQDTLDEEDNKDKPNDKQSDVNENAEKTTSNEVKPEEDMDISEPHTLTINGLKGILCYHKRKGPKKNIRWKPDTELKEIQYFELDETERVNVTKTFKDLKNLERIHEREAFQKARNLSNDDIMEERTSWRPLILVDGGGQVKIEYGKSSTEKDTQAIRQKGTLQPLYFHKSMIPDSPHEPDVETHTYAEPQIIPLEDVTGNQDNISDFRTMPWPEPKGNAPPTTSNNMNVPTMFPSNMTQFPNNFPAPPFPGVPGFQGPPIIPGEWQNGAVPPMMPNGMPGPLPTPGMPPGPMPPANMPPGMMGPPDNMMMGPEMFGNPNPMFPPVPPDGFNMQPNMFPVDYNMPGPPGPDGFPGPGNFRGAMRGRGAGGHWRGKVGGNWEGPQRGRGGRGGGVRKAVCIYFQRKGSCRQGDNCSFLHPGVNCPF